MKIGVTGAKGKIGSILVDRPNFVPLDCDVTDVSSIEKSLGDVPIGLIVNCACICPPKYNCETSYQKAIDVNVHGLANLHKVFGNKVLNISSDHVFSGNSWWLPNEEAKQSPITSYGYTKMGAEAVSLVNGGKTIRMSRTVSVNDPDISEYLYAVLNFHSVVIHVPTFLHRNYLHRDFVVDGIEYFVYHWDYLPKIVNYGGIDNLSMYNFMNKLVDSLDGNTKMILPRKEYYESEPKPKRGGLKVGLAKKLGFPMYDINDTILKLVDEYNA